MSLGELFVTVLAASGGSAIVVGGFAAFLGTIWAKRIEQREKGVSDARFKHYIVVPEKVFSSRVESEG